MSQKTCIVLRHDCFLEFCASFDGRRKSLIEIPQPFFDLRSHRDCLLDVGYLRLKDIETIVDDGTLFELRPLFASGVLWEHGFGSLKGLCLTVDGTKGDRSERAGKGLNRLIRFEMYFSHDNSCFKYKTKMQDIFP